MVEQSGLRMYRPDSAVPATASTLTWSPLEAEAFQIVGVSKAFEADDISSAALFASGGSSCPCCDRRGSQSGGTQQMPQRQVDFVLLLR